MNFIKRILSLLMPGIMESDFQNLSTVQGVGQLGCRTIVAAATIAPTTFLTIVTGTTQLVNITPPLQGAHLLCFVFPDAMGAFATTGNILVGADPGVNILMFLVYNPKTGKYIPGPVS